MPFDFAWNYRASEFGVTDPSYASPWDYALYGAFGLYYPYTFTNGDGKSINAGWDAQLGADDASASNDPRIAGQVRNGTTRTWQVNLASGSAPGAGTYSIDLAAGSGSIGHTQDFQVLDNATVLIDGTNGGSGYATATGHYIDATLTDVAATTTWTGTAVSKVFASTTAKFVLAPNALGTADLAHFRLTLQGGGFQPAWARGANALLMPGLAA